MCEDHDEPLTVADDPQPKLPQGDYTAVCKSAKWVTSFGGKKKLVLVFVIYEGEWDGTELVMFCAHHSPLRNTHKLYKQWVLAIGRTPSRGERFSRKVFPGKMYKVRVENTKGECVDGGPRSDLLQYSVVKTIIETLTGVPGGLNSSC